MNSYKMTSEISKSVERVYATCRTSLVIIPCMWLLLNPTELLFQPYQGLLCWIHDSTAAAVAYELRFQEKVG